MFCFEYRDGLLDNSEVKFTKETKTIRKLIERFRQFSVVQDSTLMMSK